jgi:pimeloyl-ACP methyl ester carboxylesterase
MAFAVKDQHVSREWTFASLSGGFFVPSNVYTQELSTTDLTDALASLSIPMLALNSTHDADSPVKTFPGIAQWDEIKRLHPGIPLRVETLANTRAYITADAPAEFDRTLAEFLRRLTS